MLGYCNTCKHRVGVERPNPPMIIKATSTELLHLHIESEIFARYTRKCLEENCNCETPILRKIDGS